MTPKYIFVAKSCICRIYKYLICMATWKNIYVTYMSKYTKYIFVKSCIIRIYFAYIFWDIFAKIYLTYIIPRPSKYIFAKSCIIRIYFAYIFWDIFAKIYLTYIIPRPSKYLFAKSCIIRIYFAYIFWVISAKLYLTYIIPRPSKYIFMPKSCICRIYISFSWGGGGGVSFAILCVILDEIDPTKFFKKFITLFTVFFGTSYSILREKKIRQWGSRLGRFGLECLIYTIRDMSHIYTYWMIWKVFFDFLICLNEKLGKYFLDHPIFYFYRDFPDYPDT